MTKNTIYILLLALLVISCSENKSRISNDIRIFDKFKEEQKVTFTNIGEYDAGVPRYIFFRDTVLTLVNGSDWSTHVCNNYSLANQRVCDSLIRYGKGANEISSFLSAGIQNDELWFFSSSHGRIQFFSKTNDSTHVMTESRSYEIGRNSGLVFTPDNKLWGGGDERELFKYQEINLRDGTKTPFGGFINQTSEEIANPIAFKVAYLRLGFAHPTKNILAFAYLHTDAVEFCDLSDTGATTVIQGPKKIDLDFKLIDIEGDKFLDVNITRTFKRGATTDKYLYLAYSGKNGSEKDHSLCSTVYVYDWEGNPIKKIVFDREFYAFTVTPDDAKIYAFEEETSSIMEASL